jgi:ferritin
MLSETMQAALNEQINAELYSAYLYLSMSAYCEAKNLAGFARWMRRQSNEEVSHGFKILDYIASQNGRVILKAVAQPPSEFPSMADLWQQTLDHERHVSGLIHKLYDLAGREHDYATQGMLQWFVSEQVEEEKTASRILEEVRMIGPSSSALLFLDRHVGKEAEAKE